MDIVTEFERSRARTVGCHDSGWKTPRELVVDTQAMIRVLGQLGFTAPLPKDVLEGIAAAATLAEFSVNDVLFREGSQQNDLLIITAGRVGLDMHVPGRGDIRILSLGPGDVVAWSALLGGGRMTASAVALEETRVVSVPADRLQSLCQSNHTFGYYLMRQLCQALGNRLVATRLQLLDLFAETGPPCSTRSNNP